MIFITAKPTTSAVLARAAADLGLNFTAVTQRPSGATQRLTKPRIGLWDMYGGSMPSGWTRWLLEQFEFDFERVYPATLDAGNLKAKFDVLPEQIVDYLALVGDNRPRVYAAMCAAQCLGGIPVPLYQDAVATEMAFPIQNAGITHALAEDQEQVDKLLEILPQCPTLTHIYFDEPRGLRHYAQTQLMGCDQLVKEGLESLRREYPDEFAAVKHHLLTWAPLHYAMSNAATMASGFV